MIHELPHTENAATSRARGCLLGQFAGDALGSMVEFQTADAIRGLYPDGLRLIGPSPVWRTLPGQPTDDSELALALVRSLITVGDFDAEAVAGAYADWLASDPFDVGNTIGHALSAMLRARDQGRSLAQAARNAGPSTSEANGALMRQSPLAIFGSTLPSAILDRHARADTVLTHPHQVCQDASAAFIVALAAVIRDGLNGEAAYEVACAWDREHGSSPSVTATLAAARTSPPDFGHNKGHVLVALQNAFFQALHAGTFEEGVVATVMGGGDTDTNGAIAGALLGAIHGVDAIPRQWRQAVLGCRPEEGQPGVSQPRPAEYWPVDAVELADQLLELGRGRSVTEVSVRVEPVPPPTSVAETRFIAALLGGAMGDALGRPAEGRSPERVRERYGRLVDYHRWRGWRSGPIGTITDDTQHTMCVAECLLHRGFLDPEDLARRFVAWLPHARGEGTATRAAVERLTQGIPWYLAGEESSGNGAAMRSAPIGLLRYRQPALLRSEAVLSSLPTHRQPMGAAGAVAMAAATAWLLTREPSHWTVAEFITAVQAAIAGLEPEPLPERRDPSILTTLHDRIGTLPELLTWDPEAVFARLHNGAYVLESLPAALYCFLRSPDNVEESLLLAVNAAHDADTVAAMAGTLGGALGGEAALPQRLLPELEYRDELTALARGLHALAHGGG